MSIKTNANEISIQLQNNPHSIAMLLARACGSEFMEIVNNVLCFVLDN